MKRFRVSVAGLMRIVLLAGVAFAALRNPDDALGQRILLALPRVAHTGGSRRWYRRAFWKGFWFLVAPTSC